MDRERLIEIIERTIYQKLTEPYGEYKTTYSTYASDEYGKDRDQDEENKEFSKFVARNLADAILNTPNPTDKCSICGKNGGSLNPKYICKKCSCTGKG